MTTVPTGAAAGKTFEMTGAGGEELVLTETLSIVAVARVAEVAPLSTARPMKTFCAMLIVWLVPTCTQLDAFEDMYALKVLPLRTTSTQ